MFIFLFVTSSLLLYNTSVIHQFRRYILRFSISLYFHSFNTFGVYLAFISSSFFLNVLLLNYHEEIFSSINFYIYVILFISHPFSNEKYLLWLCNIMYLCNDIFVNTYFCFKIILHNNTLVINIDDVKHSLKCDEKSVYKYPEALEEMTRKYARLRKKHPSFGLLCLLFKGEPTTYTNCTKAQ